MMASAIERRKSCLPVIEKYIMKVFKTCTEDRKYPECFQVAEFVQCKKSRQKTGRK